MKHLYIILIVLLVIITIGAWWMTRTSETTLAPGSGEEIGAEETVKEKQVDGGTDVTGDINAAIENVDLGDIEADLELIDSDIESL